jgi:hypothetical protein
MRNVRILCSRRPSGQCGHRASLDETGGGSLPVEKRALRRGSWSCKCWLIFAESTNIRSNAERVELRRTRR